MGISVRVRSGVTVLDLSGNIRIGEGCVALRDSFEKLVQEGRRVFILNLTQVGFMDSAAIGETVACHTRATDCGAKIKVVLLPSSRPEDVLKITSLDRVFDIFHDEDEALASFESPRAVV